MVGMEVIVTINICCDLAMAKQVEYTVSMKRPQ